MSQELYRQISTFENYPTIYLNVLMIYKNSVLVDNISSEIKVQILLSFSFAAGYLL